MILDFETMWAASEKPANLVAFFQRNLSRYEGAKDAPRLFQRVSQPTIEWVEVLLEDVRDVSEKEADRIGLMRLSGNIAWLSRGCLYSLMGTRKDTTLSGIEWRRWEYHGPHSEFGRQQFLPPELIPDPRAAGRINIISARGTYGRFESADGFDPLTAYIAAAEAWVKPFASLAGGEQPDTAARAAKTWGALSGVPTEQVLTLAHLFVGIKTAEGKKKRNNRLNNK